MSAPTPSDPKKDGGKPTPLDPTTTGGTTTGGTTTGGKPTPLDDPKS